MRIVDLTHTMTRKPNPERPPVVVRSVDPIHLLPMERLVVMATVIDLRGRPDLSNVTRSDLSGTAVAGIAGCILRTGWADAHIAGAADDPPAMDVDAAAYLLEGGVRTVAADFPILAGAADLLLHNDCALVHCLSGIGEIEEKIVRLIALPLKFEDTFSAEARVIAIEESP